MIRSLEVAIVRVARRRTLARWSAAIAAMSTAAALIAAISYRASQSDARGHASTQQVAGGPQILGYPGPGGANVVVSGAQIPLATGWQATQGSRIVTPSEGTAMLSFSTGTAVTLAEDTSLTIEEDAAVTRLHLTGGAVDLHVAKLASGCRFLVDTSDAEVEVRGTRFRVAVVAPVSACGNGTATRVTVTEGVVAVRQKWTESRVSAGERWPSACADAEETSVATTDSRPAHAGRGPPTVQRPSDLANQNDLFARASAAKQRGDVQGALSEFERLLSRYPSGPLAESACAERMRLLRAFDPVRARGAADDYVARYPKGFARGEAEAITGLR
ncbi:MAG: FecR domain-containing protein [Polyangiaceae bacterium]